jgi:pyridoxal phosphate enzyme (YggS family)
MGAEQLQGRIAANLRRVEDNIAGASGGRGVTLVCVTKYAKDEWVRALVAAGATDLAENLLPRAAERFTQFHNEGLRFTRHLIGAPQSRKARLIPGNFDMVQAVDRLKIAEMLNAMLIEVGLQLDVLLEVNIAQEEQKHGFHPAQTGEAAEVVIEDYPALRLRGLMAVPPWPDSYDSLTQFERETRRYFRQMHALFDKICADNPSVLGLDVISLGMSQDYVWAVEEGATMVRVGSALFQGL